MEFQLEAFAEELNSNELLIPAFTKIKGDDDWVVADGDRNVLENQHNGEDVVDDGGDGGGGDGGEGDGGGGGDGFASRLQLLLDEGKLLSKEENAALKNGSVSELISIRNKIIKYID